MYILDTNVISDARKVDRASHLANWLRSQSEMDLYISAITIGEISRGAALKANKDPSAALPLQDWINQTVSFYADRIIPFDTEDAAVWGKLSATLGHVSIDQMIAAQALNRGAILVTRNVADFTRTGVEVINPWDPVG